MENRNNMKCWICEKPADSSEHKIKKSGITKTYMDSFENSKMFHLKEGTLSKLQGPNSKKIKYEKTICSYCNNTGTQDFDKAYETFFDYIQNDSSNFLYKRIIDFKEVYGANFEMRQRDLFKYFVKLFGCDLRSVNHQVPNDLPELLTKKHFRTALKITFAVNEKKLGSGDPNRFGMGINSLIGNQKSATDSKLLGGYRWSIFFSFIQIFFWYNFLPHGPYGAPWIADNRYIYLGSFEEDPLVE
jgi:hypothetical protein